MSRRFLSITTAVVATLALAVGAASAAPQAKSSSAKASKASTASHSLNGTIEKVDGNTLTVKTSSGSETVMLGSDAKIHDGGKALMASDLSSHTGSKVHVNYVESNGQKMAHDVQVSGGAKAPKKSK
jgi:hypothetical protein